MHASFMQVCQQFLAMNCSVNVHVCIACGGSFTLNKQDYTVLSAYTNKQETGHNNQNTCTVYCNAVQ